MRSYRLARRRCPITEVLTEQETIAHPPACRPRHGRNLRIQTAVRLRDRHRSSDDRCLARAGVEINAFVTTGNAATADANIAECLGPAKQGKGRSQSLNVQHITAPLFSSRSPSGSLCPRGTYKSRNPEPLPSCP